MDLAATLALVGALFSGVLAASAGWRERKSIARHAFIAGMVLLAAESIFSGLSFLATSAPQIVSYQNWRFVCMSLLPGPWLYFSLAYGRGNHREFIHKWRLTLAAVILAPVAIGIGCQADLIVPIARAGDAHRVFGLGAPGIILNLLFLLGAVLVGWNLERTYRASVGTMRWRIKFMILGLGVLFAVRLFTSSLTLLFNATDAAWQTVNSGALLVACLLIVRSFFRAGHFDMDVYPSHSLLQSSLTVVLAGVYLLVVGVFAKIVTFGGGDAAFAIKAFVVLVALVLLTMLLLSDRVRSATSRFVSRHLQRPLYDYRTVWRKFTEGTAVCVTPEELCQASIKLITEVFQSLSVTIWLADDAKERLVFAASTFLSADRATSLLSHNQTMAAAIKALQQHAEPVDIDASRAPWAAGLKQCHPEEFSRGGNRVCVPLMVGGEFLGLMILGDRISGVAFSLQDLDLLKCVGGQLAAGLLNVRLSQKLLQAKELESFQTMSAFFVHDLKNAASTLNLMLANLPVHFDDPAFREDALRGTAKTVAHMNQLIERLSLLRHELKINPVKSDLNQLIARTLVDWESTSGVVLAKNFQPLPPIFIDPEQLLKVVINLVLNAREALFPGGRIRIETTQNHNWAVLSVADNGCGMSPDFLSRALFRPFQTSKKNGLGIGMFQSKMIVEAHQGRIEVESEPGQGTTFRIYLPLTT